MMTKADLYRNLPELETKRLLLRPMSTVDVSDIYTYACDTEVTRYLRWGPHQSRKQTEDYVAGVLTQYHEGEDGPWLIEDGATHRAIGHIHLMELAPEHRKAQVGFVLARHYWNRGIMTEALCKILEFSFLFGLNRVEGIPVYANRAAVRVLEKAGMKKEGELRQYLYQKGAFQDFSIYSALRREYIWR